MAEKEELKIKICTDCFIVCRATEPKCPNCEGLAFGANFGSDDDDDSGCSDGGECDDCGCCDGGA